MYRKGTEVEGVCCFCAILFFLVTPTFADAVDPNNGPFAVGDQIVFNFASNQLLFDTSVGTNGSLIDFDSAAAGGQITASGYQSTQYTLGIRWTVPLVQDVSTYSFGEWQAAGQFGGTALAWELVDLENAETVLLSGEILSSATDPNYDFLMGEPPFQSTLISADGGGEGGLIGLTISGGSLASGYPPEAKMVISVMISPDPNNFVEADLYTPGAGSVTITAVPEPATLSLILGGVALWFVRRRR